MIFEGFKLHATPFFSDAYCTNKIAKNNNSKAKSACGQTLVEVSNGFVSRALFCPHCEAIYVIQLKQYTMTKKNEDNYNRFLKQCREEMELHAVKAEAVQKYREKKK